MYYSVARDAHGDLAVWAHTGPVRSDDPWCRQIVHQETVDLFVWQATLRGLGLWDGVGPAMDRVVQAPWGKVSSS